MLRIAKCNTLSWVWSRETFLERDLLEGIAFCIPQCWNFRLKAWKRECAESRINAALKVTVTLRSAGKFSLSLTVCEFINYLNYLSSSASTEILFNSSIVVAWSFFNMQFQFEWKILNEISVIYKCITNLIWLIIYYIFMSLTLCTSLMNVFIVVPKAWKVNFI